MPTCRRKRVLLTEPSDDLLLAAQKDVNREVYLLSQTGEIFETYESYAARMSFYKLKQFQCEVTGKSGLDYFQALESEQEEARTLHSRFPEPLKAAVLRSVQWQVMGRLDNLVEAVYDRFKDRYFEGEKVFIDVQGDKFSARVAQVFPPKSLVLSHSLPKTTMGSQSLKRKRAPSAASESLSSLSQTPDSDIPVPIHTVGGDLKMSMKESLERDDPAKYFYKVQILEEDRSSIKDNMFPEGINGSIAKSDRRESGRVKERGHEKNKVNGHDENGDSKAKWGGSLMEVQCNIMSRDRLTFSKSLLRRFLRDCLDRDSSLASPWIVKSNIAQRFSLPTEMSDDIRAGVQKVRQGEIDKRKKVWEEKELQAEREGRYTKKMKRRDEKEMKAAAKTAELEARQREAGNKAAFNAKTKVEREYAAKEEAERLAATKAKSKKKPIRYPTEDLDVRITDKDKKSGMGLMRPIPSRSPEKIPFSETKGAFEGFLATWNFLVCFGQPLHLSTFTLDEYEHALRHSLSDPQCSILAEIHSVLIYNLRTIPFQRHSAVLSLLEEKKREMSVDVTGGNADIPSLDQLVAAMADVGNNWERVPLKHTEDRVGWEEALVGCLKDHATLQSFPRLRPVLTQLLFTTPDPLTPSADNHLNSFPSSRLSSPAPPNYSRETSPSERYYTLAPSDRIAILQFMCDLTVSSKAIHLHMESCEEQLTSLRKEKIEVNRQKKQLAEEMTALTEDKSDETIAEEPITINDISDMESEDIATSEAASDSGSAAGRRASSSSSRQLALRIKVQQGQAHAKQRELARARTASAKQALAEHRRLDEEVNKLERRLESIEREFRKLLGMVRVKPLGRDRFYNRFWWFDGCGGSSLLGSGGAIQYGTGRIFIQGPSDFDIEILERREEGDVEDRRKEEEGEKGMLAVGEWAVYTELEEIDELVAWLNPKGNRELALKNAIVKWWDHLAPGVRKRTADVNMVAKLPEARRSTRGKNAGSDISREPYMLWTNRKAVN